MDEESLLFSLSRFGVRLGLGPTKEFSSTLGNPQESFKSIHVAGSNGKGSTATFIYRILRRKYRSGLYTSPHFRRFSERIVVDDEEVPSDYVTQFVNRYPKTVDYNDSITNLTFFEFTTMMAFDYFRKKGVEFAAIEVGLGGRLDSTNIINPEVSVITSLSLEHTDKLGGRIQYVAREKGGIIKKDRPVVLGRMPNIAKDEVRKIANEKESAVREVDECSIQNLNLSLDGTDFLLKTDQDSYSVHLKALGEHQIYNATAAILTFESFKSSIVKEDLLDGLGESDILGRFEMRRRDPLLILDGAHNSEASRILSANIKRYRIADPLIILGVLKDKDSYNILQNLSEVSGDVIVTEPNEQERKKDAEELKEEAGLFFKDVEIRKKPKDALEEGLMRNRSVIVTGSIYLVGEVENLLDELDRSNTLLLENDSLRKGTKAA